MICFDVCQISIVMAIPSQKKRRCVTINIGYRINKDMYLSGYVKKGLWMTDGTYFVNIF